MRSILLLSLIGVLSLSNLHSQKIEENVLSYEYILKPLNPLAGMESYDFTVSTPYPENNDGLIAFAKQQHEEALADHPNKVAEAEAMYESKLASYDDDVALAQENYRLEQEAFQKLSKLERFATEPQDKPQLRMPSKPQPPVVPEPVYREPDTRTAIVFKGEVLADSYLVVDGFEKGTTNALVGEVTLNEFESGSMVTDVQVEKKYNSATKQTEEIKKYTYSIPWKRPTYLKLSYDGQVLYDGIFGETGDFVKKDYAQSPNVYNLEKGSVTMILSEIKEYINEQYGYARVETNFVVRTPKNKGDHDDLEKADKLAVKGINPLGSSDGKAEFAEAMQIWQAALAEMDADDKKARINGKIGQALHMNLIEAYLFLGEYIKAEDQLVLLRDMELKATEEAMVDNYVNRISERKERS